MSEKKKGNKKREIKTGFLSDLQTADSESCREARLTLSPLFGNEWGKGRSQEEETADLFSNPISNVPSMLVCEKRVYSQTMNSVHLYYKNKQIK